MKDERERSIVQPGNGVNAAGTGLASVIFLVNFFTCPAATAS
jgi:hypothetical protein